MRWFLNAAIYMVARCDRVSGRMRYADKNFDIPTMNDNTVFETEESSRMCEKVSRGKVLDVR